MLVHSVTIMFDELSDLSVALAEPTPEVLHRVRNTHSVINRLFNVSLLLRIHASCLAGECDEATRLLDQLCAVIDPEYHELFISISVQATNKSISPAFCRVYDRIMDGDERIALGYIQHLALQKKIPGIKKVLSRTTSSRLHILNLLLFDFACHITDADHQGIVDKAHRQALQALQLIESNLAHPSAYQLPSLGIHVPHVFSAYFECNTKEYRTTLATCLRHVYPSLSYRAPFLDKPRRPGKRRIGYLSYYLHVAHSVFCVFQGCMLHPCEDAETHVFTYGAPESVWVSEFVRDCPAHIHVLQTMDLNSLREQVEAYELDVLVYPEVGEHHVLYYASFSRLARVQAASIGHCDTSGVSTIDCYISSRLYEAPGAQQYYSERLLLLDGLLTFYVPPFSHSPGDQAGIVIAQPMKTRAQLGLPMHGPLLACLQTQWKFSHGFLEALKAITQRIPDAHVLVNRPAHDHIAMSVEEALGSQVIMLDFQRQHEYHNLLVVSDLVLVPFPFGGFCSSLDAFFYDRPVVTLEGAKLMGRFTSGFYRRMGFMECVAHTPEEYVNTTVVVELTQNPKFYQSVCNTIKANKHKLFRCEDSLKEWNDTLLKLAADD